MTIVTIVTSQAELCDHSLPSKHADDVGGISVDLSWSDDAGRRLERETFPIVVVRHVGVRIGRAIRQSGFHVATIPAEEFFMGPEFYLGYFTPLTWLITPIKNSIVAQLCKTCISSRKSKYNW